MGIAENLSEEKITSRAGFSVGQVGEFTVFDAYYQPIDKVQGQIITLMEGQGSLYAIIQTGPDLRPARLADLRNMD